MVLVLITPAVALAGVAAWAYLGLAYGIGVDSSYRWSRYAVDSTIHLGAATGGIVVATTIGWAGQIRAGAIRCWRYAIGLAP